MPCLVITALSTSDEHHYADWLATFPSTPDCAFVPSHEERAGYHYLGHFVLPLRFIGDPTNEVVDFAETKPWLASLLNFFQARG
jgi:hypothetical protein